jgi:hypothetical protein
MKALEEPSETRNAGNSGKMASLDTSVNRLTSPRPTTAFGRRCFESAVAVLVSLGNVMVAALREIAWWRWAESQGYAELPVNGGAGHRRDS